MFIYNPNAVTGVLKPKLSDVLDIFVKAGYEVTVYPTQCYQYESKKAGSYTETYDLVVCSGGDGTLDEVVTAMMAREDKVTNGYIPTGTTKEFASSLGIPKNFLDAAYLTVNRVPLALDGGRFNKGIFVFVEGF